MYAFSKRKGDCTFDQTVLKDLVHVMKHGRLKAGSKCEWFFSGRRLKGSSTTHALPANLVEATDAEPPLHPGLLRLVMKRDRCAGQFQGANAFYSTQEFKARNGCNAVDLSQTSCHGKGHADGASNTPTNALRMAAKAGDPVSAGTRGLVLFLADKMRTPSSRKSGWMSFDAYIVAYYPLDAFDESLYDAKEGYDGSSKDHFYTGIVYS